MNFLAHLEHRFQLGQAGPVGAFGADGGMSVGGPSVMVSNGPVGPFGPDGSPAGMPGEIISVEPEVQEPDGASFFGISAPFYFWQPWWWWQYPWGYTPGRFRVVCRRQETEEGEEVFVCDRAPASGMPVAYYPVTYGSPYGWW